MNDNNITTPVLPQELSPKLNQPLQQIPNGIGQSRSTFIIVGLVLLMFIVGIGTYFLGVRIDKKTEPSLTQATIDQTSPAPQTSSSIVTNNSPKIAANNSPKFVAFMRNGEIWFMDFSTNKLTKISKTTKVNSPSLSPNGKYAIYFEIVHAGGGFPTGNVYLADTQGTSEINLGVTNGYASRLTWENNGNIVGLVLFPSGTTGKAIATIFDTSTKRKIKEVELNSLLDNEYGQKVLTTDKSYNVNLNCIQLNSQYVEFCNQFQSVLNTNQASPTPSYKAEEFSKSQYAKPEYKLAKSKKLDNGLVLLEFYKGEPQNPESQWGIGGGVFVPGYDKGVTETYTILLNESTGDVIKEIPLAIDSEFIF